MSYDWSNIQTGLSYSNFDSDLVSQNSDLQLNAYDHGALGNTCTADVAYQVNDVLHLGWNARLVEDISNIRTSAGTIDKDGYTVHDAYAQWQIAPDLKLTFTVKNLFDTYYLDHATNGNYEHIEGYEGIVGLAKAERDLRLGLSWRL